MSLTPVTLRKPNSTDGFALNNLVERCKPLDTNSVYCNLLQCSHFRNTSVLAEEKGNLEVPDDTSKAPIELLNPVEEALFKIK